MHRLSCSQSRTVDQMAMEMLGIPGIVLMENAGRGAASRILELLEVTGTTIRSVGLVCGGGNNGGDGYVAARHLANAGVAVTLYSAGRPRPGTDAETNADIADRMNLPTVALEDTTHLATHAANWGRMDVLVDALLGTGFRHPVRAFFGEVIRHINQCRGPQITSLDLPSGFDADTGHVGDGAVEADLTITFAAEKVGFSQPGADRWLGRVTVAGIGVPPWLIDHVVQKSKDRM